MRVQLIPIGELLDFFNGKAPNQVDDGEFVLYGSNGKIGRSKSFNHENSIILGRVGAYCGSVEVCLDRFWASDNTIVIKTKKGYDLRYMYYRLLSFPLRSYAGGAAQPLLTQTILRGIKLQIFTDLLIQQRIASILAAYDDMIENNRRRIQLLEQAARLLYKEWFVHLRFPGHEHVKIKDGVPEGWEVGTISDFYTTASGGTPSRKNPDFYIGNIPWVKTQELNGGFILSTDERITEEAIKFSSAKLFPRHTVLVAMYGATIGQTAILSVPSVTNQACCAVIPAAPGTTFAHAYLFLSQHKTDLIGLGQGAAQKNISQQVIKAVKMVLPATRFLDAFTASVYPFFDQIEILQRMNTNLKKARDLLLPRLMNGSITV